ncbi:hypothetical protein F2Q69_00042474 [Brassica cretica]|uniref:Uncharacterized protein n=1 Tax=Brassica cretica TaxID=69181 RepID=A0A8S9N3L1_BRACR|nr:hypothetical protein F2Q69_00042474 [Brassica cretica]
MWSLADLDERIARPKPKPSEYPPEPVRTPSDDGEDPMEEDRVPTGRILRRRKEKVAKHLKRGANEKEKENFHKRVFRILLHKPFEEAYYTTDCGRSSEKPERKKKTSGECSVEPSHELFTFVDFSQRNSGGIVRDLEVQIENPGPQGKLGFTDFPSITEIDSVNFGSHNQLCLTLINPNTHYDPSPVKKPHTISRRINDPGIIAAFTVEPKGDKSVDTRPDEWENGYYNPTIAAYTRHNMHTDEYDEDYEEERATEYRAILDKENKLLHHSSWKRNAPSIDMTIWSSIDTQPQQRCRKRASTDTAYYKSIDTAVHCAQEGDYSIGSWADEHHHESFAVETTTYAPGAYKLQDSFTDEELLNMQRCDETDQIQAEAAWERTRFRYPIDREIHPSIDTRHQQSINTRHQQSIDNNNATSIDNRQIPKPLDPDGYAKAIDGRTLHVSREDIADILQTANGADNLFIQQSRHITQPSIDVDVPTSVDRQPEFGKRAYDLYGNMKFYWEEKGEYGVYRDDRRHARDLDGRMIPKPTKEFYDTAGGIDNSFIQQSRHTTQPSIDVDVPTSVDRQPEFGKRAYDLYGNMKFYWEEKGEYGVYRDDRRHARDLDGRMIPVHNKDIRRLLERASRDEPAYICLPEHASSFTQTKLVPEIYTKDEINEMFYGVCGEHERNQEALQMKLDGVYYPLNDSISWLTTCIEEMKQDIAKIQHATDVARPPSIDRR